MQIAVVGLGHTGEIYSTCLAHLGNKVIGIENNNEFVNNLKRGIPPLKESGLEKLIKRNLKKGNLEFKTDFNAVKSAEIVWFTVDTPIDKKNTGDTKKIFSYIKDTLPFIKNGSLIIVSSQLPVGTSQKIIKFIKFHRKNFKFEYAYIPENLRLGMAIESFMKPSRIVIGYEGSKLKNKLLGIFKKLTLSIFFMNIASAEMVKHATNSFLATSISFAHDIADICEVTGADIVEVASALRADPRIGPKAYVDANLGFSGGHLERDLKYLQKIGNNHKVKLPVITSVIKKNNARKENYIFEKLEPLLGNLKGKVVTFFGITYKSGTPILTHSLPLEIVKRVLSKGGKVNLYDPFIDHTEVAKEFNFRYFDIPYEAVRSSKAVLITTPWEDLKKLDFKKLEKLMLEPKIFFDTQNFFLEQEDLIRKVGLKYVGVGRS